MILCRKCGIQFESGSISPIDVVGTCELCNSVLTVICPHPLTSEQREKLRADWERITEKPGKIVILDSQPTFLQLKTFADAKMSPQQLISRDMSDRLAKQEEEAFLGYSMRTP